MDILPGDKLSQDVFNSYGLHVLSAQTVLEQSSISKLLSHNIDYVEIRREQAASPSASDTSATDRLQELYPSLQETYNTSLDTIGVLFQQALSEGKIEPGIVDASFEPLAESFKQEKSLVSLMLSLETSDDYTYQHSVQVGMLSYYISQWLGQPEAFALEAGKAGFLHDIGKSMVDPAILIKPTKLTAEEFDQIKRHSEYGKRILERSFPSDSLVVTGAMLHHERLDGSGYPGGLRGSEIPLIARIIAVADIYSAMICSRVYQKERDMLYVLQELDRLSFGQIDPHVTQVFIRNMIPHFIGKTVILESGEQGVIVLTNASDFFRPLIKLDQQFVDLSRRRDLSISKILM